MMGIMVTEAEKINVNYKIAKQFYSVRSLNQDWIVNYHP